MIERFDEEDGLDLERLLDRVHDRSDAFVPGGLTRRRRARVGAWGVAGVGAVAAAGLVVSGVLAPDDGAAPEAAPPAAATSAKDAPEASAEASAPPVTSQGAATGKVVAYVTRAQRAFHEVDLADLVLVTTKSGWIKHPGEKKSSNGVDRDIDAGDGHATRWTVITPMDSDGPPEHRGVEELKVAVRGRTDGRMTYWYIDPVAGVYSTFPWAAKTTGKLAVPSLPDQIAEFAEEIGKALAAAKEIAAAPGVTTSGPSTSPVDGRAAVCLRMAGKGDQAIVDGGPGIPADRGASGAWSWRVCFDPDTRLPVLSQFDVDYQLPELKRPSHESRTERYEWLPKGPGTEKLFAPGVDGLRKVSRDEYFKITE
ncbi:hypothetical protein ACFT5B_00310 [Luteimicrobium sp. NPDC057192]|uniref:hypothetical protein n=1 Tax=Luteimicrobium sp. NPDC057192 TaxID=3346042 RepID=UPI00363C819F